MLNYGYLISTLRNPEQVWDDEDGWLSNIDDLLMFQIIWGVNDRYVDSSFHNLHTIMFSSLI